MDTVPITLTGIPEQIYVLYKQFKNEGLTVQQLTDTKLTVYVTPLTKDEAISYLVNNR